MHREVVDKETGEKFEERASVCSSQQSTHCDSKAVAGWVLTVMSVRILPDAHIIPLQRPDQPHKALCLCFCVMFGLQKKRTLVSWRNLLTAELTEWNRVRTEDTCRVMLQKLAGNQNTASFLKMWVGVGGLRLGGGDQVVLLPHSCGWCERVCDGDRKQ